MDAKDEIGDLGPSLRKLREAAGLTTDELAAKLNTTKSVISRIENNAGRMAAKSVQRYAQVLGKN